VNYNTHARDSGITYDQYLALCDDTRHLVSPVATCKLGIDDAPVRVAERPKPPIVNIDTAPDQIDNSAEADAICADIDALIAELDDDGEPEQQIKQAPAAIVALAVPTPSVEVQAPVVVVEPPAISVSADQPLPDLAPAFRGFAALPAPNTGRAYTSEQTEALVKVQVAELQWLHRRGHRVRVRKAGYEDLMSGDEFDLDLAEEFAREEWRPEAKVKSLRLDMSQQLMLGVLSTKPARDRRRSALAYVAEIRDRLEPMVAGHKQIDLDFWCDLLLCEKLAGGSSPTAIAELYASMTGRSIDRRLVDRTLRRIRERLK
jgi:hypothetical protein